MLIHLSGEWILKNDEYTLAGNVPGDVSDDFIRAGLIKDPYFHDNYKESQWITLADWCYEKPFRCGFLSWMNLHTFALMA